MEDSGQVVRRRGVPGPAPLTRQREEYARLIARGVSNAEACRLVGVNRRTGTRWRYGRTVPARDGTERQYPAMTAITNEVPQRSARYLSEDERVIIADRRRAKRTMRAIAAELGRDVSTISRELSRNHVEGHRYRPFAAHRMATARLARPRSRKVEKDPVLAVALQDKLEEKWSPEQISNTLAMLFPDDPSRRLSPESIYHGSLRQIPCPTA